MRSAIELSNYQITEVVSGTARGVDKLGETWAESAGIPVRRFPANWRKFGRAAGGFRNSEMADYADAAVILWDGESSGTLDMIDKMRRREKPREVWVQDGGGFIYLG